MSVRTCVRFFCRSVCKFFFLFSSSFFVLILFFVLFSFFVFLSPRPAPRDSYNVIALPLAAGMLKPWLGLSLTPALAALFMASSSSLVVVSSLGLKLYSRPGEPTAREKAVRGMYEYRICAQDNKGTMSGSPGRFSEVISSACWMSMGRKKGL